MAPSSQAIAECFTLTKLDQYLFKRGFNLIVYGCTTCIVNSGPLLLEIEKSNADLKYNLIILFLVLYFLVLEIVAAIDRNWKIGYWSKI